MLAFGEGPIWNMEMKVERGEGALPCTQQSDEKQHGRLAITQRGLIRIHGADLRPLDNDIRVRVRFRKRRFIHRLEPRVTGTGRRIGAAVVCVSWRCVRHLAADGDFVRLLGRLWGHGRHRRHGDLFGVSAVVGGNFCFAFAAAERNELLAPSEDHDADFDVDEDGDENDQPDGAVEGGDAESVPFGGDPAPELFFWNLLVNREWWWEFVIWYMPHTTASPYTFPLPGDWMKRKTNAGMKGMP